MTNEGHRIVDRSDAVRYFLGGKALFTVVGKTTRFTFSVTNGTGKWEGARFVDVLTGPRNTTDFETLGMIKAGGGFIRTSRSRISTDAPSHRAFRWLVERALQDDAAFAQCEFWHHGHCSMCGRLLTDHASIERGIGPVCAQKVGF